MKSRSSCFAIIIPVMFACVLCRAQEKDRDRWPEYKNEKLGFRFEFPPGMVPEEMESAKLHVVFRMKPGKQPENSLNNLAFWRISHDSNLKDDDAKGLAKRAGDYAARDGTKVESDTVKVGKASAYRITFLKPVVGQKDVKVKTVMLFFVEQGKDFQFTAVATERSSEAFLKSAQRAFDSFTLIDAANTAPR